MKIIVFVHTEYHLFLTVNEILKFPYNNYKVYILQKPNRKRLHLDLDFSEFSNGEFSRVQVNTNYKGSFSSEHLELLKEACNPEYEKLYFFQEQDPVLLTIIKTVKRVNKSCEVCLFQDGLKPYNRMRGYSFEMLKWDVQIWKWQWNNGIKEFKPFKLLNSKKYAYTDEIDSVFLTFPESYINWNNKKIEKIEFCEHSVFKTHLEKLFAWKNDLLVHNKNIILYMTQPAHQDPQVEFDFLKMIKEKMKSPLILKLHPLTTQESIDKYRGIDDNVYCIDSLIPAEVFIMNLTDSVIISLNSTSMFYNSPFNKYYYVSNIFMDKIGRLRRYDFNKSPSTHIKMVERIDDIF
jgi:hypothetical protein